jgi:Tfp pilus assembly protein PilX
MSGSTASDRGRRRPRGLVPAAAIYLLWLVGLLVMVIVHKVHDVQ